ncbi:response regulator [Sphingobacterium corticibacter]|uniref:histidine kinase n=1 Tax=Sphingobacterium corticibacter TaxID=2171749 RepID=A0A2T8HIS1_9SPHI|nr:response regulator [Sphingobacterium corticibacter]PVH25341.1 histidine kinase [Sphingobacterium corticibacter]
MPKKIIRNLQIGFGVSFIILVTSSIASYVSISNLIDNKASVEHTYQVINASNKVWTDLQDAETGQRGYILTGDERFLEPYNQSMVTLPMAIKNLQDLIADNDAQMQRSDTLYKLIDTRLSILKRLVRTKRANETITIEQLEEGRRFMDSCRAVIDRIVDAENQLLEVRTANVYSASDNTTMLIIAAGLISLLITFYFYTRIQKELQDRERLQQELADMDRELQGRLASVERMADQIAHGNYSVKIDEQHDDLLGNLSHSLNEMSAALRQSFEILNNNEWEQKGMAQFHEVLTGNKENVELANDALNYLISYSGLVNGACYLFEDGDLVLTSTYGLKDGLPKTLKPGEGMVGQVFVDRQPKLFEELGQQEYVVNFAHGTIKLNAVLWMPIISDSKCLGVIEFGTLDAFSKTKLDFFAEACFTLANALISAKSRKQVQTLLEESQAQAEELQVQHNEMQNLNVELEAQTQKLQASEEELRVQHEELLQSNQEMEERSKLLEEKNLLIAERNVEIQQKAEELALSTKYKTEFLANMSHELRTPLNSILLLSRLMGENADGKLDEDYAESARVIHSSGTSLLTLIDEILDLSKIEAGKMELEYESVRIGDIVDDLRSLFLPIVTEKSLRFNIELDSDLPHSVEIDRQRLDQVLRNLLSNAIKFTAEGSITLTIKRDPEDNHHVLFEIRDTGIGIAEDKQQLIFEAFQQADGSTQRKFGGTGLGLSISREIARLLGGEIRLQSVENQGSTFTLIVPIDRNVVDVKPVTEDLLNSISEDVKEIESLVSDSANTFALPDIPADVEDDRDHITADDKVILIVEDDIHFAKALLQYTRQQNYKGVVAVRGDVALDYAKTYQPKAILLDIQLPIKDGWQVMSELKGHSATKHIPVHIMSSLEVKKESLLKGAIDFIRKPLLSEQIGGMFKKIEDALERYPKKVLIVEENPKHAQALAYYLSNFNIASEIKNSVEESVDALSSSEVNCVILDMGVPDRSGYETLEAIKTKEGLENLPIIIFTGKNLSHAEENKIKQYADSIVLKTAHSYQRILDEVGLFLHLVSGSDQQEQSSKNNGLGALNDVLRDKKVLIADDDVRNIFSLTKSLEQYQMKVYSAMNGKEALQQMQENPDISVILMDMMMPEMDGYESIRRVREMPQFSRLPIIAVTAKAMIGDREKCIQAGASDYISKPVDADQLLSLLRVWLYEG